VKGKADAELMRVVGETVKSMGYRIQVVQNASDSPGLPVLSVNVTKFRFKNYTWFFPIVFNWGNIIMDVSIASPDGRVLWARGYQANGQGFYSFNATANRALRKILNEMIKDMTTPEFKRAVWGNSNPQSRRSIQKSPTLVFSVNFQQFELGSQ
jgi:hypothetical protein